MAVILDGGALSRAAEAFGTSSEREIRSKIVEADLLETVVSAPREPATSIRRSSTMLSRADSRPQPS